MDFEDFCHQFTDVVVCRLVERALLWPTPHWKESRLFGQWTPAPCSPPPALNHSNRALSSVTTNSRCVGGPDQQGNRKEARLGESQTARGKDGRGEQDQEARGKDEEVDRGEQQGWEEQMDRRSRCGGCINHMDTFLHNPQVGTRAATPVVLARVKKLKEVCCFSSCLKWDARRRRCWSVCNRRTGGPEGRTEKERTCPLALRCWRWEGLWKTSLHQWRLLYLQNILQAQNVFNCVCNVCSVVVKT